MPSFSRSTLVAALLLSSMRLIVPGDESKPSTIEPGLAAADQLFRAGKFAEAETNYQALLKADPEVGACASRDRSVDVAAAEEDEAFDAVNNALATQPDSAAFVAVKGDVQFRLGEMAEAEVSYLKAKSIDPKEVRAYLGLSRLYGSYSLHRKAYDLLQSAHDIAFESIEVQRAWLGMLPRKERLAALEAYLAGPHLDDEEETKWMTEYLECLRATAYKPIHACRLVSKVEQTEIKLEIVYTPDGRRMRGIGLAAKLDDRNVHLQLDTGAGGIMVSHKIAPVSA